VQQQYSWSLSKDFRIEFQRSICFKIQKSQTQKTLIWTTLYYKLHKIEKSLIIPNNIYFQNSTIYRLLPFLCRSELEELSVAILHACRIHDWPHPLLPKLMIWFLNFLKASLEFGSQREFSPKIYTHFYLLWVWSARIRNLARVSRFSWVAFVLHDGIYIQDSKGGASCATMME
jgi:hypothetical protein